MKWFWPIVVLAMMSLVSGALGDGECKCDGTGPTCAEGFCCSKYNYCGQTDEYCGPTHCQCQCKAPSPPPSPTPPAPDSPISSIIDIYLFDELLKHRNDTNCEGHGFYTYYAFITAANSFPAFGTIGDLETRKREIAAFLAQTSHETTGGWDTAPDPQSWGYCYVSEIDKSDRHCVNDTTNPCAPGKYYYGRGPIQLSYNYNYGPAGRYLGYDLLSDPDTLANDAVLSFKSAFWFWMTPQDPKPSCHDVMIGTAKTTKERPLGFGLTTNIINGGLECNTSVSKYVAQQKDRILYYKKYCKELGVSYGDFVDCCNQPPFGLGGLQDM